MLKEEKIVEVGMVDFLGETVIQSNSNNWSSLLVSKIELS